MSSRITFISFLFGLAAALTGCNDRSVSEESTPALQRASFAQLSAGGGIAGFDFYISGRRVGTLLVTNGAYDEYDGYYDEKEYWRWDQPALDQLAGGSVSRFDVDFAGTSDKWDSRLVRNFEQGTDRWTAWVVNRQFDLQNDAEMVWNDADNGRPLYHMRTNLWGELTGSIDYYLKMDFTLGNGYPEMTWYIDYADFRNWLFAEKTDDDDNGIYEVRLEEATSFRQTSAAYGYELKTAK